MAVTGEGMTVLAAPAQAPGGVDGDVPTRVDVVSGVVSRKPKKNAESSSMIAVAAVSRFLGLQVRVHFVTPAHIAG